MEGWRKAGKGEGRGKNDLKGFGMSSLADGTTQKNKKRPGKWVCREEVD